MALREAQLFGQHRPQHCMYHFHTRLETSEVYYTLSGEGYMVMENPEGDMIEIPLNGKSSIPVKLIHAIPSISL